MLPYPGAEHIMFLRVERAPVRITLCPSRPFVRHSLVVIDRSLLLISLPRGDLFVSDRHSGFTNDYSVNVNLIKYKLDGIPALAIAFGNFLSIFIPALVILFVVDFPWSEITVSPDLQTSLCYIFILSLFGTAIAKVMFNELVSISTPVFSISITYFLPIVAIGWGILDDEHFSLIQWIGCALILFGVYLITDKSKKK